MTAVGPRSDMLFEMGQCAYRLGKVFGEAAERAETFERKLEYFQLFDRCFFAVRMSVALELRLRREARAEGRAYAEVGEREAAERDPIEREAPETEGFTEAERDREREPVSLPVLLTTLNGIAADASALPGPPPAALPTLRELLAKLKAEPAPTVRPSAGGGLRTRLAASATTPAFVLPGLAPPSGGRGALPLRRATGPPR
jgi:hypothetical protein